MLTEVSIFHVLVAVATSKGVVRHCGLLQRDTKLEVSSPVDIFCALFCMSITTPHTQIYAHSVYASSYAYLHTLYLRQIHALIYHPIAS